MTSINGETPHIDMSAAGDDRLPCDVKLPGVLLKRGTSVATLMAALKAREEWPEERTRLKVSAPIPKLSDPFAVMIMMMRGEIAKPEFDSLQRIYPEMGVLMAELSLLRQGVKLRRALEDALVHLKQNVDVSAKTKGDYDSPIAAYDRGVAVLAEMVDAEAAQSSSGLGWVVRERRGSDGKLLDCFVEAPRCEGMAYGLEVLGDDYTGYGEVEAKLEHCKLIVAWANASPATEIG